MGRRIQPARMIGTGVPSVQSMQYTTGQTFKKGALLVAVAAGTLSECGADPALVTAVALEDAGSKPGFEPANSSQVVATTGRVQEVSVAMADRHTIFSMRGVNGGTDPVTPQITDIDTKFGVLKVGNDWVLDTAEVTVTPFEVVDVDIDNKIFFCKFNEANLSLP